MKTKKLLSLALALILALSAVALTSCGSSAPMVPIVCGETGMNDLCGIATYGVNYYNLGVKAGDMAADILLNEADTATMKVQGDPDPALSVNTTVAEAINFTIPESVSSKVSGGETKKVTRVDEALAAEGGDYTVGILQLVQHVALDQSNEGFQDQLSKRMSEAGKTVTILDKNANGDEANNVTIAENFVSQNVNLIYTIATSSSQAAANATKESKIPVVFNAVTDPVDAGLVASLDAPGANVTGVSDMNPVEKQIDLIGELLGKDDVKIGFLYTSSETNSQMQVKLGKAQCDAKGYTYVEKGIVDMNDIESALTALAKEGVDAIYIPTDNVLANACAMVHSVNIGE
ncbi:MAG: sugar ABC transporter substrate-binding protein [Ruminococcaceae bacterium]|nr:sugar ABC transporter substrate-binding protein [Oscillospiraceae bacterium]